MSMVFREMLSVLSSRIDSVTVISVMVAFVRRGRRTGAILAKSRCDPCSVHDLTEGRLEARNPGC